MSFATRPRFVSIRGLSTVSDCFKRLLPPPAIDGTIVINCDDVCDPRSGETQYFLDQMVNHYAPVIDYQTLHDFVDLSTIELANTTDGEIELFSNGPYMTSHQAIYTFRLHKSRCIQRRSFSIRMLLTIKTMVNSMKAHYYRLYNTGIALWEEHGSNCDYFKPILFVDPSQPQQLEDIIAWRYLPILESMVLIGRHLLSIKLDSSLWDSTYVSHGVLSLQGLFNLFANEMKHLICFHNLEATKLLVFGYLDNFFANNPPPLALVPLISDSDEEDETPVAQTFIQRFTYGNLVDSVDHLRKVQSFLMMRMIYVNLKDSGSIDSNFHKIPFDLFVVIGSYLTGEELSHRLLALA